MKNLTPEVISALKTNYTFCSLIRMDLSGGIIRLTDAGHDIVYNGQTYLSSGLVASVAGIKQQQELRVASIDLQFSAVDQSIVALFSNANQQNRKVIISTLILENDAHTPIGTTSVITNIINKHSIDDDENGATIVVNVSNFLAEFEAVRGIRTTQSSFKRFYPNSTAFINSKDVGNDLKWGGK